VPSFLQGTYRDGFSTGSGEIGDEIEVSSLLGNLPVALLERTVADDATPPADSDATSDDG
jgi:hypothetical protein